MGEKRDELRAALLHRIAAAALLVFAVSVIACIGFGLWVVMVYPADGTVRVLCTFIYVTSVGSFVRNSAELWQEWRKP